MNDFNTIYDFALKSSILHYHLYPELMPYVGSNWDSLNKKILLIGESHYLKPGGTPFKSNSDTWYTLDPSFLESDHRNNINTRCVIRDADHYKVSENSYYCKAHSIFYNMKSAIGTALDKDVSGKTIFENFSYYNYFQRPAELVGGSISVTEKDRAVAFDTLKEIVLILKPTHIIFVSTKAYDNLSKAIKSDNFLLSIERFRIPHPACAWWNIGVRRFDNRTGKEEFSRIIQYSGLTIN